MPLPGFQEMLGTLIAEPSVSCTSPDVDQSNLGVVEHLAGWLEDLGASIELMPLPRRPRQDQSYRDPGRG